MANLHSMYNIVGYTRHRMEHTLPHTQEPRRTRDSCDWFELFWNACRQRVLGLRLCEPLSPKSPVDVVIVFTKRQQPPRSHLRVLCKSTPATLEWPGMGTQRRTKVAPRHIPFSYCGWPKGTSREEAKSNSKEMKVVVISMAELCLAEGISKWGREWVS